MRQPHLVKPYRRYHPRWHRERMPVLWWLGKPSYTKFMVRELTSIAVGYSAVMLLIQVSALSLGEAAYQGFLDWLAHPAVVAVNVVVLAAALFHAVTWLNLAPKAMKLRLRGRAVPDRLVLLAHYATWCGFTLIALWAFTAL